MVKKITAAYYQVYKTVCSVHKGVYFSVDKGLKSHKYYICVSSLCIDIRTDLNRYKVLGNKIIKVIQKGGFLYCMEQMKKEEKNSIKMPC